MGKDFLEQCIQFIFTVIATDVADIRITAEAIAVFLIENRRLSIINLIIVDVERAQSVVNPRHPQESRLGMLIIVFQSDFRFESFCRLHRPGHEEIVRIGMTADAERFQGTVDDVDAVRTIADASLSPVVIDRCRIGRGESFRPFRKNSAHEQGIAVAQKAAVLPVHATAIEAARLVAGVVGKEAKDLFLRFGQG